MIPTKYFVLLFLCSDEDFLSNNISEIKVFLRHSLAKLYKYITAQFFLGIPRLLTLQSL